MKTAHAQNVFLTLVSVLGFSVACTFGEPTYDKDQVPSLTSKEDTDNEKSDISVGGGGSTVCPSNCTKIQIQSFKPNEGLSPSKRTLGLDSNNCVCPTSSGGAKNSTSLAGTAGNGSTQDPPSGGMTSTSYSSYGGASSAGGVGNTQDPIGGTGNTQDPPTGGKTSTTTLTGGSGSTQDPPLTGGKSGVGGASSTGGVGNTQDPPTGGKTSTTTSTGGSGSTQDPPPTGGKTSTGGSSATGGKSSTGGSSAMGGSGNTQDPPVGGTTSFGGNAGTGGSSNCTKQSYKFYVTQAEESLGSGTVTCTNLVTQKVITTTCSSAECCYYDIPTSCDRWACHQINRSVGMPRIPSYDPISGKGVLEWGADSIITTGDHYWLEEGIDYNIVCDQGHLCELILEPHAGERFYL